MTTNDQPTGRSAASRRALRAASFLVSACLLAGAALPAAAEHNNLAIDVADGTLASDRGNSLQDAMTQPDQALMLASQLAAIGFEPQALAPDKPVTGRIKTLMQRALALLGTPYRWGGTSENGFDCSGLVGYVFKTALGIDLPRVSRDMAKSGERVERSGLVAGDLVFFSRRGRRVDHVGIYVGEGKFVHAPRTGKDVMVSRLDTGYWSQKFMQARRMPGD